MKIPLSKIDIDDDIRKSVESVLDSGKFILGQNTSKFEERFAKFCNAKFAACVSSGTAALFITLQCLSLKKDDEIIVPSHSFIATVTPILMLQAKPKFVDVDPKNYTIDPDQIEKQITRKTKGIIPVHLYGHPADMKKIKEIAKKYSLFIIEDAAQAHGAKYKNKFIGSIGDASTFSFYPSKNLTVCGDGGIIVSNNEELIHKAKMLRNHGRTEKYYHRIIGYNLRFNEIQAAIGIQMLKKLPKMNNKRRSLAKKYSDMLDENLIKPVEEKWAYHVYYMYTIRTRNRDKLEKYLNKMGIGNGIHYPIPIHKQPIIKGRGINLPITEEICKTTLSIPMFPSLRDKQQNYVIKSINRFMKENG